MAIEDGLSIVLVCILLPVPTSIVVRTAFLGECVIPDSMLCFFPLITIHQNVKWHNKNTKYNNKDYYCILYCYTRKNYFPHDTFKRGSCYLWACNI